MIKKYLLIFVAVVLPKSSVFAQSFVPLSTEDSAAQLGIGTSVSILQFVNRLFYFSIGIASVLAVIMIVIGGFRYMTSESVFKIGGAKEMIFDALVGLIIVLSAVLILNVINPDIATINLFRAGS